MAKATRVWLEGPDDADSYIKLTKEDYDGRVELKLADCYRSISWSFGSAETKDKKALKRSQAKIAKIKAVIDEIYKHFHGEEK